MGKGKNRRRSRSKKSLPVKRGGATAATCGHTPDSVEDESIVLRDYQEACLDAIAAAGDGRHLIQMATGLGKTVTFSRIPVKGRTLIISHRDELVRQPERYFGGRSFGIEKAAEHSHGEDVVSASIQTISRSNRLKLFDPEEFDLIITDEAHHAAAATYRKVFDYFKPRVHLGFSATPNRGDKVRLTDAYDDIIFERSLLWGIHEGWLSDIYARRVKLRYNPKGIKVSAGDYQIAELDAEFNTRYNNRIVAEAVRDYATGPTIVFALTRRHAQGLAELIPGSAVLLGTTPAEERRGILRAYAAGDIPCIVNCSVLTEGADLPMTSTIVIARPTRSVALYTQMVGRGTRLYPGKDGCVLIDCVGTSDDKNLCCAPTLAGIDPLAKPSKANCDEGRLSDMPIRYRQVNDIPVNWLVTSEEFSLFGKAAEVAWTHHYDGSYSVSCGGGVTLSVSAPDLLGESTLSLSSLGVEPEVILSGEPVEHCLDEAVNLLNSRFSGSKTLWAFDRAKRWSSRKATEKQVDYISALAKKADVSMVGVDFDDITKKDAGILIDNFKRLLSSGNQDVFGKPASQKQLRFLFSLAFGCHYRNVPGTVDTVKPVSSMLAGALIDELNGGEGNHSRVTAAMAVAGWAEPEKRTVEQVRQYAVSLFLPDEERVENGGEISVSDTLILQ